MDTALAKIIEELKALNEEIKADNDAALTNEEFYVKEGRAKFLTALVMDAHTWGTTIDNETYQNSLHWRVM